MYISPSFDRATWALQPSLHTEHGFQILARMTLHEELLKVWRPARRLSAEVGALSGRLVALFTSLKELTVASASPMPKIFTELSNV